MKDRLNVITFNVIKLKNNYISERRGFFVGEMSVDASCWDWNFDGCPDGERFCLGPEGETSSWRLIGWCCEWEFAVLFVELVSICNQEKYWQLAHK